MLHLPDITLVVLAGNHIAASVAAIDDTLRQFSFDDVIVFADEPMDLGIGIEMVVVPFRSVEDATRVAWREVWPRLKTGHAMSMHWDGYPVRPELWDDGFRDFDYIGAVWPWFTERQVGNSGFSLQSRKFLTALNEDRSIPMKQPEDITLCRDYGGYLKDVHGIRFAPEDVADRFSVEHGPGTSCSLGFHGVWNFLYVMTDDEIKARLMLMGRDQWGKQQIDTLGYRAVIAGRRELYRWINRTRGEVLSV